MATTITVDALFDERVDMTFANEAGDKYAVTLTAAEAERLAWILIHRAKKSREEQQP